MSLSKAQGDPTAPQAELDLLADGRELLERWTASPRFRYLYPEGPNLAILLEAYQELDRRRVVGRVRPKRRAQQRAMRRIIRRLAQLDAIARHRRLRWRYPPPRVRPPHVMPSLVRRALGQVDPDARRLVRARLAGQWAPPDPGATLTTEATREARGLEQLRDALINEALAHPEGLAKLHPQFLLFAASAPPRKRRYPIASFLLVTLPLRLVMGLMLLLTTLYVGAFLFFNDQRLGSFVSSRISGLVEGELEMGSIHWTPSLIVDLVTGQPHHVVVEDVTIWEPYASYGGQRKQRTAWARRLEADLVLHEIIPWNRLGVPTTFEIPWLLHFSSVRSDDDAWFVVREYDDVTAKGETRTLLSLIDAFRPLEPPEPDVRGISFRVDRAQLARARLSVDFMHGLEGWRTIADLRDLGFVLAYDAPSPTEGTPPRLPLRFDVDGMGVTGSFELDDIEVPFTNMRIDRLACGLSDAPLGDVGFDAQGLAADSPLELHGWLRDAFARELTAHEPLPLDAVVSWGTFARAELDAFSRDPAELASHLEQQLGLARGTIMAAEGATVRGRVEGPLTEPRYHLAGEGLALDLLGEPAWTMDDVKLSVSIEQAPLPDRWRETLPADARRLVAHFDTFEGTALDGSFALDPMADEGALVVFPEDDESFLIAAPLDLVGVNPAQLSPDDPQIAQTLSGQADGRLDLYTLEIGPPLPEDDSDEGGDPTVAPAPIVDEAEAELAPTTEPEDDELTMRLARLELTDVRVVRDRGPQDDGIPRRLRADGTVVIDADGHIDLDGLVVRTDGTTLRTSGGVDGTLAHLDSTHLALDVDDGQAFARAFGIDPYFDVLDAEITVSGATMAPNGRDGQLLVSGLAFQGGTATTAAMSMRKGVLTVDAPKAQIYGGKGSVHAEVTLFENGELRGDPKIKATIALSGVELATLVDPQLSGTADVELTLGDAEGRAQPLSRLEVRGRALVPELRFGGTRYRNAEVEFSLGPESLTIHRLELPVHRSISPFHAPDVTVPIGRIIAKGSVGLSSDPALDLEVEAEGVPLRLVARLLEADVPVRGRIGRGTSLVVGGTMRRPAVGGTVQLSGLSAEGIALGDGLLEVTSEDLPANGPLASHRELRVGGELRTPEGRAGGIQWTLDAVVALGETPRSRRKKDSGLPPLDAEVDVRFDRISLDTLLRGLNRGTGNAPTITGRLDQLGAHVLTCDPGAAMISDCLDEHRSERSLEISLQLDGAWVSGREPTTADPCQDPGVLCTASALEASIDWPKIVLDRPWAWRTGGVTPTQLTLTGDLDLSEPPPDAGTASERSSQVCRAPELGSLDQPAPPDGAARAEVHGAVDLGVVAELLGSDVLRQAEGRLDVDLALTGPAAQTRISGRVTLPDGPKGESEGLSLHLGETELPLTIRDLDLRIDEQWLAATGKLAVMGDELEFGTVRDEHTGYAFRGPCEGTYGLAAHGTVGYRLINGLYGDTIATAGGLEVARLVARGNVDDPEPLEQAAGSIKVGRETLTLELDEGLPPVELVDGTVDVALCTPERCPFELAPGSLAIHVGGERGARGSERPTEALRAKIGPRGTAFAWGTTYLSPDFRSVDGTGVTLTLEDVPYRGYDQRGRPVYEAELSSSAITFEGGIPLVVSGGVDVARARYVQDAVQGVEMLAFTDDVELPSAPPPEIIRDLQFDLRVETSSPLRLENNVAHGVEADAIMEITGTYERPEFTGRVDVEPGGTVDIPFLTGTYEIQRGRITLLRELEDAEVDVLALRRELVYIDDTPRQVYLLLGGTPEAITWKCIAEGDTSGAVETQRGCLDYLVLGAGDVQNSALTVQRTGGGGLANARKPLQVVGHVTEFDFGRKIEEAAPRFGPYVPDVRLRLGQIGPELEVATPEEWLDFDYVHGTAALDYTRGYPGFLLQQSRELTFQLEAIDLLVFEVSRDIRSYLNNRIIFDPLRQTTVEFRVDFEIPSLR
ncbi:MAG: translocation/assembly module TamB domain-containing protein [Myxococcales bacterium]|nr:translocation/assembly module TamB domain-containing protein [Myxococcales bacterium]